MDKLVSREYEIAQLWFAQDDPKAPKDKISPGTAASTGGFRSSTPRDTRSRPSSTSGRTIPPAPWPTTPPCRSPSYYMTHHDYESAAIYYEQFIAEHHKSPLLQEAQLAADRRAAQRLPGPRLRRGRPRESSRDGQEDDGRPLAFSRRAPKGSITRST